MVISYLEAVHICDVEMFVDTVCRPSKSQFEHYAKLICCLFPAENRVIMQFSVCAFIGDGRSVEMGGGKVRRTGGWKSPSGV